LGHLDVPSPHAHPKCSQQAHHFHQLGVGLFLEEHCSSIDFAGGAESLVFVITFNKN
jgi:hypothetical protein